MPVLSILLVSLNFISCGSSTQGDKGGDHVPEGELYLVDKMPTSAGGSGIDAKPINSKYFQPFVRPSQSYLICFAPKEFTEEQVKRIDETVHFKSGHANQSGLAVVLNFALENISRWDSKRV
jgi:hypothetical protein